MFLMKEIAGDLIPEVTIVDVGAMMEGRPRYDVLVRSYRTLVTGFEPNAEECRKLSASGDPGKRFLPYFVGNGRDATFNTARYPGCSSLYTPDRAVIDRFVTIGASRGGNFEILESERVVTHRLDDVYDRPTAHYLKLDVQGAELDVLQHGIETLRTCLVIETEVEFVPLYKDQPLFGDIQCFLREQGFMLHKLIDVAGRCFHPFQMGDNAFVPMSQMLWADAIFVRDITRLDRLGDNGLLISAAILHDVYLSYDLVHLFLSTYDDCNGTDFNATYMQKLKAETDLDILYLNQKTQP